METVSSSKTSSFSTFPTSTTTILDLPELPLLTIFDNIPLPILLHIDEVCRAWQKLKEPALGRRHQLIITSGKADLALLASQNLDSQQHSLLGMIFEENGPQRLMLHQMRLDRHALFIGRSRSLQKAATLDRLLRLLPNLKVFRYVQQNGSNQELLKVTQLLDHYRHQLVKVTIWFWGELSFTGGERNRSEQMFTSLMTSLNRLTALRSLELNFQPLPGCPVVLNDHQLAAHSLPDVAGRLKWLKFNTRLEFDGLSEPGYVSDARLLSQVLFRMRDEKGGGGGDKVVAAASSKSKQKQQKQKQQKKKQEDLKLYVTGTPLTMRTLISLGPGPVAAGLRTVEIDGIFSADSAAEYKALARLALQSPHLQALTVHLKSLSIHRLVQSLASLTELVYLYIFCRPTNSPPPRSVNICKLPVLSSVKKLELTFPALSHGDYEQLHLEVLFPNLRIVIWSHISWGCTDCGYLIPWEERDQYWRNPNYLKFNAKQFKASYGREIQRCVQLARLVAFSRLPQLKYLQVKVRPSNLQLPFKDELFSNSLQSLNRLTEFVDLNSVGPNEGPYIVVYED